MDKEIWLVGKGPSLDNFDWSTAGKERIGINEVALLIPNCTGAIAIDHNILNLYRIKRISNDTTVYVKKDNPQHIFVNDYRWEIGKEVKRFEGGTINIAVELFHFLGARKIHFIGCDSIDNYAGYSMDVIINRYEGKNLDNYKHINGFLLKTIERLGIQAIWEHRDV